MGCSQSQPSTAAVATSKDDPQAGLNKNKKREKQGSAGTESTGISTQHDNENGTEDDNDNNDNNSRDSTYYNEQDAMAPSTSLYGTVKHKATNKPTDTSSKDYLTLRYACVSQRGRDPDAKQKPNQDAYSIIVPPTDDNNDNNVDNHFLFFGVYDGHGAQGERCAQFVQRKLPGLVQEKLDSVFLYDNEVHALKAAHLECNQLLRESSINDSASGTTAISCYWHPNEPSITVCNVGDSRAILGSQRGNNGHNNATTAVVAVPLSKDQTPHRRDEAYRCTQAGARILSFGQIDPRNMGDASQDEEDPPRVWHPTGMYPGTAFTRSLGDAMAESLGVIAEPEVLRLKLTPSEKVIVIASDGVFDVMSNQQVIDICMQHIQDDPIDACNAVIRESYKEWLKNEDCLDDEEAASYDDTTVCIIFIGEKETEIPAFDKDSVPETLSPAPHPPVHQHHGKRVRQKTLRNLEEMAEQ
jgi:cGMP-dependent protein kinase